MIDLYCERCGPGLFAEPLNALSNLAFFAAAFAAWRFGRATASLSPGAWALIALAAAVGVGSGLFHTFATEWASVLDLAPILLFQLVFLWLYLRGAGLSAFVTAGVIAAYAVVSLSMTRLPPYFNGSILYAPTFVVLAGLAAFHATARRPGRWLLGVAAGVFAVSLTFRTVDEILCPYLPIGTHFLWHLFNGVLLYLATRTVMVSRRSA